MEGTYATGKRKSDLTGPFQGTDRLFAAQRVDGQTLAKPAYEHCVFANVSFMETTIADGRFLDCVFIACYFKKSHISATSFIGCRFIDCRFPRIRLSSCNFRYSTFEKCVMPFEEMVDNLPSEQNLREDLCRSLHTESRHLGLWQQVRKYRLEELRAYEKNLLKIARAESTWYKEHYDGPQRMRAFLEYISCLFNRFLWGYGERVLSLAANYLIIMLLIFPLLYWLNGHGLIRLDGSETGFVDCIKFSIRNALLLSSSALMRPGSPVVWFFVGLQPFVSAVFASLFASYMFRYISR